MLTRDLLYVQDELILFLVANGLKPSGIISIGKQSLESLSTKRKNHRRRVLGEGYTPKQILDEFEEIIEEREVFYDGPHRPYFLRTRKIFGLPLPNIVRLDGYRYRISHDKESLDKLLKAKNDQEMGLALGYPVEAVEAYVQGRGSPIVIAVSKFVQTRQEYPPLWLAYVLFIPDQLDLVNNNISPSTLAQAKSYQDFTRQNHPDLAQRVEANLLYHL